MASRSWLALCLALPVSALAQENPNLAVPTFESLDRNTDNRLSRSEAAYNRLLSEIFVACDVDGDGFVSRSEYEATTSTTATSEIVRFDTP
jgi:hypothetical protein